uniref:Uncharacterized protein n=1 Tax=Anguilla anguilla TaxID=7936 RepID=A0A0E9XNW2_ANGAN
MMAELYRLLKSKQKYIGGKSSIQKSPYHINDILKQGRECIKINSFLLFYPSNTALSPL